MIFYYYLGLEPAKIINIEKINNTLNITLHYTQIGNFEKNVLCFINDTNSICLDDLILNEIQINYDLSKYLIYGGKYKFYISTKGLDGTHENSSISEEIKTG